MATTIHYSFYQVSKETSVDKTDLYPVGAIVFNKKLKELTIVGQNEVTTYAGGLATASFSEETKKLIITDFSGVPLEVDLSVYATSEAVGNLIGNYYTKSEVDNALTTKANKDDVYTKDEIDGIVEGIEGSISDVPSYTIDKETTAENGYSATYQLYSVVGGNKTAVGTKINIPKDMVVSSGQVVTNPTGQPAGTYIELTLANATNEKLYIPVNKLIDVYGGSTYIKVENGTISIITDELDKAYLSLEKGGTIAGQVIFEKSVKPKSSNVDIGTQNNKFNTVYAANFSGNAATATKATSDGNGNNIADTYATKADMCWQALN